MARKLSWTWRGKRYYGIEIPSRETSTHRFAKTKNDKVKKIRKKK